MPRIFLVLACLAAATISSTSPRPANAFMLTPPVRLPSSSTQPLFAVIKESPAQPNRSERRPTTSDSDILTDEEVLRLTPKATFIELCQHFKLSTEGTKTDLLQRIRSYAQGKIEEDRVRLEERRVRFEEGGGSSRERYEIIDEEVGESHDFDGPCFYYAAPEIQEENTNSTQSNNETSVSSDHKRSKKPARITPGVVTAPPPETVEPNEKGERVATVYSSSDQNDLTGIAAAQPGQGGASDLTAAADLGKAPWESTNPTQRESASKGELDIAREEIIELFQGLLAMSGAPAFQQDADDLQSLGIHREVSPYAAPEGFVGFDPAKVPPEMLTKASKCLRIGRGNVLQEVIRDFELRAIGMDGMRGDNIESGGGHYREVSKVRLFLEGYRKAEVRRLSRGTISMLLDKLVTEGIEGLDETLASMIRSNDDTSDEPGELNDSLLDYLNDAIRQQEKKIEQMSLESTDLDELEASKGNNGDAALDQVWKVDFEQGQRVETFDPKDPQNQKVLQEESERIAQEQLPEPEIPTSAPKRLLMILQLLRERIKTEAAFSHDETSLNLRTLAYCLKLHSDAERKELIVKEFGSSLDRLDTFAELVAGSVEYSESTSHQLHPSRGSLNVEHLKGILNLTRETRRELERRASKHGAT